MSNTDKKYNLGFLRAINPYKDIENNKKTNSNC